MLERSQNFVPDGAWETKESRERHVLAFIEMRHFLALSRQYGEVELAKRITDANHFEAQLQWGAPVLKKKGGPVTHTSPEMPCPARAPLNLEGHPADAGSRVWGDEIRLTNIVRATDG